MKLLKQKMVSCTRKNKAGAKFGKLNKEQRRCLTTPITPLNMKSACREHAVSYLSLLERKSYGLREISRLGKDIKGCSLKFSAEFVYNLMEDMYTLLKDYVRIKDRLVYNDYAEEAKHDFNRKFIDRCVCLEDYNL